MLVGVRIIGPATSKGGASPNSLETQASVTTSHDETAVAYLHLRGTRRRDRGRIVATGASPRVWDSTQNVPRAFRIKAIAQKMPRSFNLDKRLG